MKCCLLFHPPREGGLGKDRKYLVSLTGRTGRSHSSGSEQGFHSFTHSFNHSLIFNPRELEII